jgi:hypothetical protein
VHRGARRTTRRNRCTDLGPTPVTAPTCTRSRSGGVRTPANSDEPPSFRSSMRATTIIAAPSRRRMPSASRVSVGPTRAEIGCTRASSSGQAPRKRLQHELLCPHGKRVAWIHGNRLRQYQQPVPLAVDAPPHDPIEADQRHSRTDRSWHKRKKRGECGAKKQRAPKRRRRDAEVLANYPPKNALAVSDRLPHAVTVYRLGHEARGGAAPKPGERGGPRGGNGFGNEPHASPPETAPRLRRAAHFPSAITRRSDTRPDYGVHLRNRRSEVRILSGVRAGWCGIDLVAGEQ